MNSVKVSNDEKFFKVLLKCGRHREMRQQVDTHTNIDFLVGSFSDVTALETELRQQRYIHIHTYTFALLCKFLEAKANIN